jgi:hypothetical protein
MLARVLAGHGAAVVLAARQIEKLRSLDLHGEPDGLRALARLAVRRNGLLEERKQLASGKAVDDDGKRISAAFARKVELGKKP